MAMAASPRVAVVILNWRRPSDTLACVASVVGLDHERLDIIVCDNDSGDGSIEAIEAGVGERLSAWNAERRERGHRPFRVERHAGPGEIASAPADTADGRLCVVQTGRNGGYAFGNNVGLRVSLAAPDVEYAWLLNNDTLVDAAALTRLVRTMRTDPAIGILGALVLYADRPTTVQTLGGGRFLPTRARCDQIGTGLPRDAAPDAATVEAQLSYVNGAAAFVSRAFLDEVGLMEEGYFLYFEEIDWAVAARKAGFRLGYCPDAIVFHQVGASTGSNDDSLPSPTSTYHMERSRFRFLRRHHPALLAIAAPLVVKGAVTMLARGHAPTAKAMLRGALGLAPPRR